MVNKLIIRNCLKKGAIFAGIIITLIAVPFLVVCNTEQFGNLGTNQGSKSGGNDQFSPKLNASVSNVDWQNPDVGYAVEFASTYGYSKSYLARIGAATNNALGKISHQSSYSKTETLLNFNLAGIGVSTTWGEAGASLLNEPTTNVSIIDFAADTVIPQVGTPYHIDPATPTRSLVDKITSVVISDYANVSSYSPITDIGFYSFSGLTRAFSQYDGTRSWYKANGSNTTSTFFNNLQSFKAQSSNNGEAGSGTKLGLTTVHNGAFYNATKLSTVDFGFDNRLTTFDEPYGPSEFQKTGFYPWPDVTGDFGRVNDQTTWNGIFENDTNLTSVELWQKYYGYDSKKENDAYQANFHEATLLNIPANLFKNCTKLTSFNTKVKNTAAIPFSVKTIGDSAFENAQLINNIIFSEDIKSIGRLGGTQNRYIQHFTFSQPNPSDELLNNLTNFALDNCNVGTVNYYVHVPYNYNDVSIRTNAYYRAIGGSARSNLFIQYTRPEKFLFLNWKTDLGAYSGVIGNEVDLDTNIIIKPLPEYSNVSGMNSYFATKKGVTATAPILIKWPSDTLQQWYDGFLIQLRIYNENGISGVKNVSLTATQYFDENYLDGYATNISVTSKSATAKISFYNINTSSITFYDDGIVGGTSGTNTLPVMRGDTGYMGSDGDWKNVALRGLVSAVEIPDTGPYAGVSLSFSEITLDRKNGTPVTTLPTIPSWITLEDIHIFQKPGDISTVITSYYLKIAPTVFSEVGVYQFKILATANLNTAISKASSKLSVQIYDVFDYTYSPVFPAVFDQSPTAACGLDSYHTEYFVNKRGGISGGNKENIINGSFALPTLNVTWVNGYAPSSISTKLSYTTTAMSLNGALYNGDEWISIKNSKLSYDSNLLTQGYVVQQMAADVNGNYSDIILISITATTMNENWLVTKTFIYYIRITLTTSAVWTNDTNNLKLTYNLQLRHIPAMVLKFKATVPDAAANYSSSYLVSGSFKFYKERWNAVDNTYEIFWNDTKYTNVSTTATFYSVIRIAARDPATNKIIYKYLTLNFWDLRENMSSISEDASRGELDFPSAGTMESTNIDGELYDVASTVQIGGQSYIYDTQGGISPVFNYQFHANISYIGIGYPVSQDGNDTMNIIDPATQNEVDIYSWSTSWTIEGNNAKVPPTSGLYDDPDSPELFNSGLFISNTGGPNIPDEELPDGSLYWTNLYSSIPPEYFTDIFFRIRLRVHFAWQDVTENFLIRSDEYQGPLPWNIIGVSRTDPSFNADAPVTTGYIQNTYDSKALVPTAVGISGEMPHPYRVDIYGVNLTTDIINSFSFQLQSQTDDPIPAWLKVASYRDGSGKAPGTVYWTDDLKMVTDPLHPIRFKVQAISSYNSQFDSETNQVYSIFVNDAPALDWTFVDPNVTYETPEEYFDSSLNNFTPDPNIVLKAYNSSFDSPQSRNKKYFDIVVNKNTTEATVGTALKIERTNGLEDAKFNSTVQVIGTTAINAQYTRYHLLIEAPTFADTPVYSFQIRISNLNSDAAYYSSNINLYLWDYQSKDVISTLKYKTSTYDIKPRQQNNHTIYTGVTDRPTYRQNIKYNWSASDKKFENFDPLAVSGSLRYVIKTVKYDKRDISYTYFNTDEYTKWLSIRIIDEIEDSEFGVLYPGVILFDIFHESIPANIASYYGKYTFTIELQLFDFYSPAQEIIDSVTADVSFNFSQYIPPDAGGGGGGSSWIWILVIIVIIVVGIYLYMKAKKSGHAHFAIFSSLHKKKIVDAAIETSEGEEDAAKGTGFETETDDSEAPKFTDYSRPERDSTSGTTSSSHPVASPGF